MIDLVLVKKDMLRYMQDEGAVRRIGRGLLGQHVLLCKVRLHVHGLRREVVNGRSRIRGKK